MRITSSASLRMLFICAVFSSPAIVFGQEIKGMNAEIQILGGKQLKLVDLALAEFRKNHLNSSGYQRSVYRTENGYVAIFEDPNMAPGQRGSSPVMLSFVIKFDNDCEVIRSHFIR
ncbi:hypothetical protein [Microbulbifer sp. 2205BS26-8]|uniref:hypothetical protein n=1 Tax=Microbulbifer sp. 2205BS26-8 TaxID=3064386 RepID=UPI00273DB445|nr:hypothetical protein [Microbulbifer sp. 2205BS26-8]MDP5209716.1 hypothetical protein [Microbulbifer sp. 2205BS26-8]